jgi:hypothetical protein
MVCLTSYYCLKDSRDKLPENQVFEYFGTVFVHTHTHTHTHTQESSSYVFFARVSYKKVQVTQALLTASVPVCRAYTPVVEMKLIIIINFLKTIKHGKTKE